MASAVGKDIHLLEIDVVGELHVLGVDPHDLQPAGRVRNSNVNLAIKPTCSHATDGLVNATPYNSSCYRRKISMCLSFLCFVCRMGSKMNQTLFENALIDRRFQVYMRRESIGYVCAAPLEEQRIMPDGIRFRTDR